MESNDSKINNVQSTIAIHKGDDKLNSTTHMPTHHLSTSRQFSTNDCAPFGSGDSSVDPPFHDGSKDPPVCHASSGDQRDLAEGKESINAQSDH